MPPEWEESAKRIRWISSSSSNNSSNGGAELSKSADGVLEDRILGFVIVVGAEVFDCGLGQI